MEIVVQVVNVFVIGDQEYTVTSPGQYAQYSGSAAVPQLRQ
jgi:hypothetical protein